jgi:hypothetical protein
MIITKSLLQRCHTGGVLYSTTSSYGWPWSSSKQIPCFHLELLRCELVHLNPNANTALGCFSILCECWLRIPPDANLFWYFYYHVPVFSGIRLTLHHNRRKEYLNTKFRGDTVPSQTWGVSLHQRVHPLVDPLTWLPGETAFECSRLADPNCDPSAGKSLNFLLSSMHWYCNLIGLLLWLGLSAKEVARLVAFMFDKGLSRWPDGFACSIQQREPHLQR